MNNNRATIEIIAPSVEEAIAKGLQDLGLPREAVEVEVLDAGSRGLFGLGTRQARIRLIVGDQEASKVQEGAVPVAATPAVAVKAEPGPEMPAAAPRPLPVAEPREQPQVLPPEEGDPALDAARQTVSDLLEKMSVQASVTARYGEPDDPKARIPVIVEIRGDDLSILIGKRSETLNALQYIASLIVGKKLGHSLALVVDVEGYRSRREGQLRLLARRMAEQVTKSGRRQALEPMSAGERRIIHMELRDHPDVTTESVGEEPYRKVTILPKE